MVGYLSYLLTEEENQKLTAEIKKWAARYVDERWEYYLFTSAEKAAEKLIGEPCIHLFGWDVTKPDAVETLKMIRRERKEPLLLLVADEKISPAVYLKPSISPEALLLKPLNKETVQTVLWEVFQELQQRFYDGTQEEMFSAESREGKLILPLKRIDCFEARNKKIYVRSGQEEYGFYSSLEEVQKRLPKEFIQCHRSFIVNTDHVRNIDFTHLILQMENGVKIPFSRRYRPVIKEYWSER